VTVVSSQSVCRVSSDSSNLHYDSGLLECNTCSLEVRYQQFRRTYCICVEILILMAKVPLPPKQWHHIAQGQNKWVLCLFNSAVPFQVIPFVMMVECTRYLVGHL
jgi:hypothetical protein